MKNMTAQEICLMMESGRKAQVSELNYGALSIVFGKSTEEAPEAQLQNPGPLASSPPIPQAQGIAPEQIAQEQLEIDALIAKEEQIAHMIVENPLLAEELLRKEALEKADEEVDEPEDGE